MSTVHALEVRSNTTLLHVRALISAWVSTVPAVNGKPRYRIPGTGAHVSTVPATVVVSVEGLLQIPANLIAVTEPSPSTMITAAPTIEASATVVLVGVPLAIEAEVPEATTWGRELEFGSPLSITKCLDILMEIY